MFTSGIRAYSQLIGTPLRLDISTTAGARSSSASVLVTICKLLNNPMNKLSDQFLSGQDAAESRQEFADQAMDVGQGWLRNRISEAILRWRRHGCVMLVDVPVGSRPRELMRPQVPRPATAASGADEEALHLTQSLAKLAPEFYQFQLRTLRGCHACGMCRPKRRNLAVDFGLQLDVNRQRHAVGECDG